jgi:hypothetical protein
MEPSSSCFRVRFQAKIAEDPTSAQVQPTRAMGANKHRHDADPSLVSRGPGTLAYIDIVPTIHLNSLNEVAGDVYQVSFADGETITVSGVAGMCMMTYAP